MDDRILDKVSEMAAKKYERLLLSRRSLDDVDVRSEIIDGDNKVVIEIRTEYNSEQDSYAMMGHYKDGVASVLVQIGPDFFPPYHFVADLAGKIRHELHHAVSGAGDDGPARPDMGDVKSIKKYYLDTYEVAAHKAELDLVGRLSGITFPLVARARLNLLYKYGVRNGADKAALRKIIRKIESKWCER